ncbi:conserved hypothetical protein [Ricinus communis]|uniref:RNase H type-1 domain-containing protein n=1 Tax=Ricinus communis TaxID=3988 RepID=B9SUN8_RICCO|nr:conserved hypothetical protein [Ricinus communis]
MVGMGFILRDEIGQLLSCDSRSMHGTCTSKEAEAKALWEAISWVKSLHYTQVIFELYSKQAVDAINFSNLDM